MAPRTLAALVAVAAALALAPGADLAAQTPAPRPRARDIGITVGILRTGPLNAITDVAGVRVGQVTVAAGDSINTGITAILPHGGNVFLEKVPAAVSVGNGFGKLTGIAQIRELGEIESPIVLTCTLCVPRAADGVLTYLLGLPGNGNVQSANAVVGETNDGGLNLIRLRPITEAQVLEAIRSAREGPVEEGSVGAGRGTVAFGWKGGIGTSSRVLPPALGGWTVGVLVQTNFGGILTIGGAPVGQRLGRFYLQGQVQPSAVSRQPSEPSAISRPPSADGSIMIVVATDAPLDPRGLERLAQRAFLGVARTGSPMTNGSGDFAIAFSTAAAVRRNPLGPGQLTRSAEAVANDAMSPLFEAVVEATEEAILNSLFRAEPVRGPRGTVGALPLDSVVPILREYRVIR
jgi:D-aminopeptidase